MHVTQTEQSLRDLSPGQAASIEVDGQPVTVVNVDGKLFAFDDLCTHRQCSLAEGQFEASVVTCPCHGSQFDVTTGDVVRGPARMPLATYEVEVTADGLRVGGATGQETTPEEQQETESALAQVALFAGLDAAAIHMLQELTFRRLFQPGEQIVEEGRTGNGLYIILSGKVEVVRGLPDRPQVLATMGPGEPFGELALLGDWKRTASVQAVEETLCAGIDRWVFLAYLRREPALAARMTQLLAQRLVETDPDLGIEVLQHLAQRIVEADHRLFG